MAGATFNWHCFVDVGDGSGRGCDCIFVDHPAIERAGGLYNDDDGKEYKDNLYRFTLLSLAAMEAPLDKKLRIPIIYNRMRPAARTPPPPDYMCWFVNCWVSKFTKMDHILPPG